MPTPAAHASAFELRETPRRAEEVVEALLERIGAIDDLASPIALRSVLAVSATARADARRTRDHAGPLAGVPVLVKDNIEVAGMPSSAGATSLTGRPATEDAPLVARLREAGAVVLGTTNLSQWANLRSPRSSSGWSAVGGLTGNPWALDRSAGGSSSGSGAAVAAGLAPLAVGTETDGSIVCPASLNGVAGIKPTVGSVPGTRIVPLSHSQDSAGPMARTVDEVALLLEVLSGTSGVLDRTREGVRGLRVGVASGWRTGHAPTDALAEQAASRLAAAGATVVEVAATRPPAHIAADELTVMLCELHDGFATYLPTRGAGGPQDLAGVVAHEQAEAAVELAHFGHELFERALTLGGCATDAYRSARRRCLDWALRGCLVPATAEVDLLVSPAYGPAWKIDLVHGDQVSADAGATRAPAMAGWPIATAPIGLVAGLPVGMAAVGPPGSEALLLAACRVVERPDRPALHPPSRG